ncbi:MAG TPA: TonB-dependent receptor [Terriglobales bacterium]|nr:TonB-dependent receptor [Terriglobales bacterium]
MHGLLQTRLCLLWSIAALCLANPALAQVSPDSAPARLIVSVVDENGIAVTAARIFLQPPGAGNPLHCETDFSGRCAFADLAPGSYQLRVERPDFYTASVPAVEVGVITNVDVTLTHQKEVREVVSVVESPPAIDPAQIASQETLSGIDIINLPYPGTRDYRNALNFIPGVVQDSSGQPHTAGSETYQTLTLLDGFNITQPANGQLLARVSTDAFRSVVVETTRIPAEDGKASGGVLNLNTGIGDDHYRFIATNFTPSVQDKKGLALDSVDPRFTFSGPIHKGKMWYFDGFDGEYNNIIVPELPNGADQDEFWRIGNLAKIQTNLTAGNILTTSFLFNHLHDPHYGLSPQTPRDSTPSDVESVFAGSVKDQHSFSGGELLETGFAFNQYDLALTPLGTEPYAITPDTALGNYYLMEKTLGTRWQALANLYLPTHQWHGRHEFKVGVDLDRLRYNAAFSRQPISFLRAGQQPPPASGTCLTVSPSPCSRYSSFSGSNESTTFNSEASGYAEDRWLVTDRLLIEPGLRFDWDQIVRRSLLSPRLAGTYVLDQEGNTKLSAGVGLIYDATPLFLVARPFAGQRTDYFFDNSGNPEGTPVLSTFSADTSALEAPRSLNWSLSLEKKLPRAIYLKADFLERRGVHGFVYNTPGCAATCNFILQNTRHDDYDALQLSLRHNFRGSYMMMGAYTRSRAHSNQVLDFNIDNPVLSPQAPGPYSWETPNRFLSWGIVPFFKLPIIHKIDLAYSMEARTGFAFSAINSQQQIVNGGPDAFRFPTYFSFNLYAEKRFRLFGAYWALRGGFDNLTGHDNPLSVNNNVDAGAQFLTFSNPIGRAFTTRIRFLGRK